MIQIKNKKSLIINLVCILLYAVFTLILLFHHEIWGDEAQAWLVVRDLDIWGIFLHVRTEGHPLLWYFVLFPFAKLFEENYILIQIINWFVIVVAMGIWIFKSPFNYFAKISLMLSSGFLYWYAVMARSYCFIPLFMFLIAVFYRKQKEHPFIYAALIILLANTHVIMLGFCTALALIFLFNNRDKKSLFIASLMFCAFACITCYLWGSQNENIIVKNLPKKSFWESFFSSLDSSVFNLYGTVNIFYIIIFYLFNITSGIILFLKNKQVFFVYIFNVIFQFCIYIFIWIQLPQRIYTLLLVTVFCFWILYTQYGTKLKNFINMLIILAFLSSLPGAFTLIKQEISSNFTDGKKAAEFIKKNIPQDAFIVSNYPLTTLAVSVNLPQNKGKWKFFYPGYNDFYTFSKWNKTINPCNTPLPLMDLLKNHDEIYIIMSAGGFYEDLKPIYVSSDNILSKQEILKIYHLKKEQFYGKN